MATTAVTRPFGWAGLLLDLPVHWRLCQFHGAAKRGFVALADDEQVRFHLAWARIDARRFDPQRDLRRRLLDYLPKDQRRSAQVHTLEQAQLKPLFHHRDEPRHVARWIGYAPATGRAIEARCHQRGDQTDRLIASAMTRLTDQSAHTPQRWAFFGHRLTTPAGFVFRHATLNIGDMQLSLAGPGRATLGIRLIYPATLALQRLDMSGWLNRLLTERRTPYRAPRVSRWRRAPLDIQHLQTPRGQTCACDARIRFTSALIHWTMPRTLRSVLLHDSQRNRLVLVQCRHRTDQIDPVIQQVFAGLDWPDAGVGDE